MIFETKKVPLETLGEYLTGVRQQLGLTVADVVEKTGICEKYLLWLEQGKYHHLPPNVYVLGFLKKLSQTYSVPVQTLLVQYKKERGILEQVANKVVEPPKGWRKWVSQIVVTPKIITIGTSATLAFIAVFYLIFSVAAINRAPGVKIFEPASGTVVKGSSVTVSGQTDPGAILTVNGQQVAVDSQGKFKVGLGVDAGQKQLTVTAQNKFGKQSSRQVSIMVDNSPSSAPVAQDASANATVAAAQPTASSAPLSLQLKFSKAATIKINKDGIDSAPETVTANSSKTVEAQGKITITTSDAGATTAELNGKNLGVLGRSKESVTVPFTVNTSSSN